MDANYAFRHKETGFLNKSRTLEGINKVLEADPKITDKFEVVRLTVVSLADVPVTFYYKQVML